MNPALSVVFFTTLAGAAQGLVVALALAALGGLAVGAGFTAAMLATAATLLVVGLGCSFLHLGRPERAWRAATMWRTSWLSREVIVLPAFIAVVAVWWGAVQAGATPAWTRFAFPGTALALAALLWLCTAMIYACLRFIEEWAHPLTLAGFVLIGLSSGFLLATAAAEAAGEGALAHWTGPAALVATVLAGGARLLALRRNARIRHRSTLQSATGIAAARLVQTSMGMSAGSFNTREFFHRASVAGMRRARTLLLVLGFALPAILAAIGLATTTSWPWLAAAIVQLPGLIVDRWFFFAQARHPQNLYYQVVS
ncbi:MAG: dimethyl sulfoxide reductase anchor subunit [Burkholderiales bacterium]|nr:dimethyl sulfoxide reductase anchor subunit [Burkholderiales bacterium]